MKSKTFSGRSLRSSLKGSTWILVLLLLGFMVAFPVAELMLIGNQTDEIHRMTFAMICSYLIVPGFLVTMLAAVVNALNEFWYLFSRDKIDFYHSLPVTRSRSFWEKAIRGLVLYLVPYVIMELITMAIAVSKGHGSHPQRVYKILSEWNLNEKDLTNLEQEFRTDDHRYWESKKPDQKPNPMLSRKWGEINDGIETDLETFSQEAGERDGDFLEQIKTENRSRYDYREFLRKFAVFHEELAVDDDSFDYNFYTYGLRLYGNMPLIEPLESKEVKKIEEFVIVIDTSMSCSGELVRKFLEETYGVLSESESFFTKINVHIIQCDEKVHTDKRITSRKEMKDYMEHLELYGDGGTDFRPAFEWVDKLLEQHEFHNLKGMIYFTDGFGIYPKKMPPYKTAFVFMQDNYRDVDVPVWAMKLILDEDDFEKPDR